MMSDHSEALREGSVTELLRWALASLGDEWSNLLPIDVIASEFRALGGSEQEPWPALGLELHLPNSADDPYHIDLCLMKWLATSRHDTPRQWCHSPIIEPGVSIASDYAMAEYDVVDQSLKPMGTFCRVTHSGEYVWPEGLLRDLHRYCDVPSMIGVTQGRGAGIIAVTFGISTDEVWSHIPTKLEKLLNIGNLSERFSQLERFRANNTAARIGISIKADGTFLPRVSIEIPGLKYSEENSSTLLATGITAHALSVWKDIKSKIPKAQYVNHLLPEAPYFEIPSQLKVLQDVHAKISFQAGRSTLKLYLRLECVPATEVKLSKKLNTYQAIDQLLEPLTLLRAHARRAASGPVHHEDWARGLCDELPPHMRALPFVFIMWPILRAEWNRLIDHLGFQGTENVDQSVLDELICNGLSELNADIGPSLNQTWEDFRSSSGLSSHVDPVSRGEAQSLTLGAQIAWCRSELRSGLTSWFMSQPDIALRLLSILRSWSNKTTEFINNISKSQTNL